MDEFANMSDEELRQYVYGTKESVGLLDKAELFALMTRVRRATRLRK